MDLTLNKMENNLSIPKNFVPTAPAHNSSTLESCGKININSQTVELCEKLCKNQALMRKLSQITKKKKQDEFFKY